MLFLSFAYPFAYLPSFCFFKSTLLRYNFYIVNNMHQFTCKSISVWIFLTTPTKHLLAKSPIIFMLPNSTISSQSSSYLDSWQHSTQSIPISSSTPCLHLVFRTEHLGFPATCDHSILSPLLNPFFSQPVMLEG